MANTTVPPASVPNPQPSVLSGRGIVAAAHPFAAAAGLEALRRGGNAVDAAIAAAAVLMTVEPRNGHLGGDSFFLISLPAPAGHRAVAINASGAAPAAATRDRYRALGGIPPHGLLAATVPGTVSGWALARDRYGSRPLAELLAPAIEHAEAGVPVGERLHRMIAADADLYRRRPNAARIFLPGGEVPPVGSRWRQTNLAASLRRIAAGGRDVFYHGDLAAAMARASADQGGLFTRDDFAAHESEELAPLAIDYRGYTVYEQPPVSQGLIVLLALNILERFDLPALTPGSAAVTHLQLEALKLAFADRLRHLGDPRHTAIPLDHLLSKEHAREQAARIDPRRALPLPFPPPVQPDTTSLVTADASGMMVAYIHSLFSGARVVLGDTGVLMNSRLLGFNLEEGHPNCLAPGKRPVHTLNGYLVYRDGRPILAGNTPGAHWQVQTNLQILVNALDHGMDPRQAIEAPRFTLGDQLDLGDPTVKLEERFGDAAIADLRERGHQVAPIGPWEAAGAVQLVARDPRTGVYSGATEVRRTDCTVLGL